LVLIWERNVKEGGRLEILEGATGARGGTMTTLTMGPVATTPGARQLVVKTAYGAVRGSAADGVNAFMGIPYAAAPFGPNRLRPPRPVQPWSGVRDALTAGPMPPQLPYPPGIVG
jgi:hypothetical protein